MIGLTLLQKIQSFIVNFIQSRFIYIQVCKRSSANLQQIAGEKAVGNLPIVIPAVSSSSSGKSGKFIISSEVSPLTYPSSSSENDDKNKRTKLTRARDENLFNLREPGSQ